MKKLISKDFIFSENSDGSLTFNGAFDEYYQNEGDPWQQSGNGDDGEYYQASRQRLVSIIQQKRPTTVLEIGCGLGFVCDLIAEQTSCKVDGWDISNTAIQRAKEKFPQHEFSQIDIAQDLPEKVMQKTKYDMIILNQLLWYILPELDKVIDNCLSILAPGGHLVISNAFARDQRFGKEYINGFTGAFDYFSTLSSHWQLHHVEYNDDGFRNLDGLFIIEKPDSPKL